MAKVNKFRRRSASDHCRTHSSVSSCSSKVSNDVNSRKRSSRASQKKEWEDSLCSVCMEHPHNSVLLLCSSYHKGCRPYMCSTSSRYSNCLDQYKKAYMKVNDSACAQQWQGMTDTPYDLSEVDHPNGKAEKTELLCPLCRGQVKGWTVVEAARKYLNSKKRSCMQDKCSFVGNYRELRKHVRVEHPLSCPREADPSHVERWKKLENERELSDVFSTIRSTIPGAIIMGDYVIERPRHGFWRNNNIGDGINHDLFELESSGQHWSDDYSSDSLYEDYDSLDEDDFLVRRDGSGVGSRRLPQVSSHRGQVLLGQSRRRRRRRQA